MVGEHLGLWFSTHTALLGTHNLVTGVMRSGSPSPLIRVGWPGRLLPSTLKVCLDGHPFLGALELADPLPLCPQEVVAALPGLFISGAAHGPPAQLVLPGGNSLLVEGEGPAPWINIRHPGF